MGTVIAHRPEQCGTTAKTSEWQRADPKTGGPGGNAPGALSSGFLRRKPGSRPESGGNPRRRSVPATILIQDLPSQGLNEGHQLLHHGLLGHLLDHLPVAEKEPLPVPSGDAHIGSRGLSGAVDGTAHHRHGDGLGDGFQPLLHRLGQGDEVNLGPATGGAGDEVRPLPAQADGLENVPGGGSRLSLEKARTQRVAGGCPRPPGLGPARSHSLVLAVVAHRSGGWAIPNPMYVP